MSETSRTKKLWIALSAIVIMATEWILLVACTRVDEMIVGAASVLLATVFLATVIRMSKLKLHFCASDVIAGWRIPWYVLSDSYTLVAILVRDLFTSHRADSLYRVCSFKTSKDDPRLVARRVLATIYTSASPNSIVLGIDYRQSRMLFHQVQRSGVSTMMQDLGANS